MKTLSKTQKGAVLNFILTASGPAFAMKDNQGSYIKQTLVSKTVDKKAPVPYACRKSTGPGLTNCLLNDYSKDPENNGIGMYLLKTPEDKGYSVKQLCDFFSNKILEAAEKLRETTVIDVGRINIKCDAVNTNGNSFGIRYHVGGREIVVPRSQIPDSYERVVKLHYAFTNPLKPNQ